jgi:hypothetical protein
MTKGQPITNESVNSESEVLCQQRHAQIPIDRILQKLSRKELPVKGHFERYMHHKLRLNGKWRMVSSSFKSVMLFLGLYGNRARESSRRWDGP